MLKRCLPLFHNPDARRLAEKTVPATFACDSDTSEYKRAAQKYNLMIL